MAGLPELPDAADASASEVKTPGRQGGINPIAQFGQNLQRSIAYLQIRRAEIENGLSGDLGDDIS
jgi:hypothetical protein